MKTQSPHSTVAPVEATMAAYKDQIRLERDRILLGNFITAMRVGVANAVVLSAVFLQYAALWKIGLWFVLMVGASVARWRLSLVLLRRKEEISTRHMRILLVLTALAGAGWGASPLLLDTDASVAALGVSVFMIAGMTAAAGLSFASHTSIVSAFTIPALLALAVYFLINPGPEEIIMTMILVSYYASIRQLTLRSKQTLLRALTNEARTESQKQRIESQKKAFAALAENYREAAEQAKSADMTKSVFIANMSHEIRTPMNGVIGMLTALCRTSLTSDQKRFVDIAQKSANGLLQMINGVLDLSKIESGKMTLSDSAFSLSDTLDVIIESLRHDAVAKGLALNIDIDEQAPSAVIGDETRLRQVLFNLAGNAVKFTDAGSVDISVKRVGTGGDGRIALAFSVRDTGIGIAEDDIERLFNRFERAASDRVRETAGAGLGLAIASELVGLMGGKLKCESVVNEGSVFSFTIVVKTPAAAPGGETAGADPCKVKPERLDLKLLVAEDNAVNRQVVLALLEQTGVRIVFAVNGREAVEKATSQACDAVLMDIHMPVMGGAAAAAAIRESGLGPDKLPIIAATADADFGETAAFRDAQMNAVIYKPFRGDELIDVLKAVNAGRLGEDAA